MRLHEEYLKRHQLSVPIIKHVPLGHLIVRNSGETCFNVSTVNWTVLKMKWEDPVYHPGFYLFKFLQPYKTNLSDSNFLRAKDEEIKIRWDEYEDYLLNWTANFKPSMFITDPMEIVMTVWEMFIYSHEQTIIERYRSLSNLFFKTLDFHSNLAGRYNSYVKLLKLVDQNDFPFNMWRRNLNEIAQNYSPWIAKLHA